ncbi:MAG: hypothetical protein J7L11_07235 [Thermoprotei archaeon]|nr:hypothetical protein [Thermoprotei archaeon]
MSTEIENILSKYEGDVEELNRVWNGYRQTANRVINSWVIDKHKLTSKISELQGLLNKYEEELKELMIRYNIGLIDDELLSKMAESLKEDIAKVEGELRTLKERTERLEKACIAHAIQARLAYGGLSINEVKAKIARLEELREQGKILDEVYNKIRGELEEQLRILEETIAALQGVQQPVETELLTQEKAAEVHTETEGEGEATEEGGGEEAEGTQ